MLDISFAQWLHTSGFRNRSISMPGGRVIVRLGDGSGHVSLYGEDWRALEARIEAESRAVVREANRFLIALFPGIFFFGMTVGQLIPFAGLIILAGIFLGPLAIYLWQSRQIQRIARAAEAELARHPRVAAPPPRLSRSPRWLQIAVFLLAGPHLLFQVYGSIDPDAYRNTPLSGTQIDATGIIAFLLLVAMGGYRLRGYLLERRATPARQEAANRRVDFVSRANRDAG